MARTYKHLWEQIATFDALHRGYLKARRGKRFTSEAMRFSANLEVELFRLLEELASGRYRLGEYRRFTVREPKAREVAALPFRDRVVQHALMTVIEPIWEREFISDSFACRVGLGTHAGADRLTQFLRVASRWDSAFVFKADVQKFFPSIDHDILKGLLRRRIGCEKTWWLMETIIDSWNYETGKGLPIGNLTSQLFANIYLHELDLYIKQDLRQRFYLRYMDDFVVIGPDKPELHEVWRKTEAFLAERLKLTLNRKTRLFPAAQGVDFLGYKVWATHRLLRKRSVVGMKRRLKAYYRKVERGDLDYQQLRNRLMSWIGHAQHANTYRLRERIFSKPVP